MKVLAKLWFMKNKAVLRNLFSKPSSAILTILMVLFYGGLFVMMLSMDRSKILMSNTLDVHTTILLAIGFSAIMMMIALFQKEKRYLCRRMHFILLQDPLKQNKY